MYPIIILKQLYKVCKNCPVKLSASLTLCDVISYACLFNKGIFKDCLFHHQLNNHRMNYEIYKMAENRR